MMTDPLTDDQRTRLDALLQELDHTPLPELIAEGTRLCNLPPTEKELIRERMQVALGAAVAVQKTYFYFATLRNIDKQRRAYGHESHARCLRAKQLTAQQNLDAANEAVQSIRANGMQDVTFHLFAICVARIERLVKHAYEATCKPLPDEERAVFKPYRELRDFYEHIDNRFPGRIHAADNVTEEQIDETWHVRIGAATDEQGRIVLHGKEPVDLSERGIDALAAFTQRILDTIKARVLADVRAHFEADPSDIPSPAEVKPGLLLRWEHLC